MPPTPGAIATVICRRRSRLLVPAFAFLLGLFANATPVRATMVDQEPRGGLLVTLAATAEDPDLVAPVSAGLVLQVTLANQTGQTLTGLRLQAPVPPRSRVTDSWRGVPGHSPGRVSERSVTWSDLNLQNGEHLGPFVYRVVPEDGADGAIIFRDATIQPEITWTRPGVGRATPPVLRLNGLWGEGGLRRTVLPTGLTIFTRERPDSPTVSLRLAVRAGSRDEDETINGGSHLLEHAFFLGTPSRPDDQAVFNAIARVGGQTNASTSREWTDFWHLMPAEHFDLALDVLADQILNSTFPREAFERERLVVFEEIRRALDTPGGRASREFLRLVFRASPLSRDALGTIESVQSIPFETVLAYKEKHYVTGNIAIAAAGNLRHDEAVAKIAQAFASLPPGPRLERPRIPEPAQTEPRRLEIGTGTRRAEIRLGWPAPGHDDPDWAAMVLIEDILGTTGRRLAEEIRDRQALATSVGPAYLDFSDAGALLIAASTQPDRTEDVIDRILAEVQRLRDGDISDQEIQASLRALAGRRALEEETNQGQTVRARAEVAGTLESYAESLARLRQVTAADMQRVALKYLDPAHFTLVIVRA